MLRNKKHPATSSPVTDQLLRGDDSSALRSRETIVERYERQLPRISPVAMRGGWRTYNVSRIGFVHSALSRLPSQMVHEEESEWVAPRETPWRLPREITSRVKWTRGQRDIWAMITASVPEYSQFPECDPGGIIISKRRASGSRWVTRQ